MSAVATYWDRLKRAFILPGAVSTAEQFWGIAPETYKPAEYGEYIATSNAVYVCATRRADAISSVPLVFYRGTGDKRTPIERGQLVDLFGRVNPFWTFTRLMHMTSQTLDLWGECFWFFDRGQSGGLTPREIWWANPHKVKVYPDPANYVAKFGYTPDDGGQEHFFTPRETLWLRNPNPLDEWSGLSRIAAARLAADTMSAAMKSNRAMFSNGMRIAGIISPKAGQPIWTDDQLQAISKGIERKFKGDENAHKWALLKTEMTFSPMQMSQKDAEFVELHRMTLEDICRAFAVPLDLIGGQRTYANAAEARQAFWADGIAPTLRFVASEITEQILPMFPGQADAAEFDLSGIEALQENEDAKQLRIRENFRAGLLTYDESREALGLDPLPNGKGNVIASPFNMLWIDPAKLIDQTAASVYVRPETAIAVDANADPNAPPPNQPDANPSGKAKPKPNAPAASQNDPGQEKPRAVPSNTRAVAYGSDEHRRLWERAVSRTDRHEATFGRVTANLMRDQRKSVLSRLNGRTARAADPEELAAAPFVMAEWVKKFRAALRPVYLQIVQETGEAALREIGIGVAFDVQDPHVLRFIETRSQRFAQQVNETTWDALRTSLRDGIDAGESIPDLANRVNDVMGDRIRSSAEVIARTETIGASNGGTLESWRQSGVVKGKTWLAALDERTRDTHIEAHNQTVPIDSDFLVGGGAGPAPGQIGLAEEDCNCRCAMTAVLDVDWQGEQ